MLVAVTKFSKIFLISIAILHAFSHSMSPSFSIFLVDKSLILNLQKCLSYFGQSPKHLFSISIQLYCVAASSVHAHVIIIKKNRLHNSFYLQTKEEKKKRKKRFNNNTNNCFLTFNILFFFHSFAFTQLSRFINLYFCIIYFIIFHNTNKKKKKNPTMTTRGLARR